MEKFPELTEEGAKNYKSIGKAVGESYALCVYLAHKHNEDLFERCVGYRIIKGYKINSMLSEVTGKEYISIEFYERI